MAYCSESIYRPLVFLKHGFYIIFASLVLQIIAVSTDGWSTILTNGTTVIQEGLWRRCENDEKTFCCQNLDVLLYEVNNGIPVMLTLTRASQLLGVGGGFITVALIFYYAMNPASRLILCCKLFLPMLLSFLTGAVQSAGIWVYLQMYRNETWMQNSQPFWSLPLAGISAVLSMANAVMMVIAQLARIRRESSQIYTIPMENDFPSFWENDSEEEHRKLFDVRPDSTEYDRIISALTNTLEDIRIEVISIQRLQNHSLYREFATHIKNNTFSKRTNKIKQLWHGVDSKSVNLILQNGFCRCYRDRYGKKHGPGIYFGVNSSYATDPFISPPSGTERHQKIFYCKVFVGDYIVGNYDMQHQPVHEDGYFYNSTVDNADNPKLFVIYRDTQAYPEYLLTIKTTEGEVQQQRHRRPRCSVCLDKEVNRSVRPCGHCFCNICIAEIQTRRGNCPTCRNNITEILRVYI